MKSQSKNSVSQLTLISIFVSSLLGFSNIGIPLHLTFKTLDNNKTQVLVSETSLNLQNGKRAIFFLYNSPSDFILEGTAYFREIFVRNSVTTGTSDYFKPRKFPNNELEVICVEGTRFQISRIKKFSKITDLKFLLRKKGVKTSKLNMKDQDNLDNTKISFFFLNNREQNFNINYVFFSYHEDELPASFDGFSHFQILLRYVPINPGTKLSQSPEKFQFEYNGINSYPKGQIIKNGTELKLEFKKYAFCEDSKEIWEALSSQLSVISEECSSRSTTTTDSRPIHLSLSGCKTENQNEEDNCRKSEDSD